MNFKREFGIFVASINVLAVVANVYLLGSTHYIPSNILAILCIVVCGYNAYNIIARYEEWW